MKTFKDMLLHINDFDEIKCKMVVADIPFKVEYQRIREHWLETVINVELDCSVVDIYHTDELITRLKNLYKRGLVLTSLKEKFM